MDRIELWVNLWEDLIDNVSKGAYDFELYNPRILVDDILDEIEFNELQNRENKLFFYDKLSTYINEDDVIKNRFLSQFKILRRDFNTDRINLIKQIALEIQHIFLKGIYFKESLDLLKKNLLNEIEATYHDYQKLKYVSTSLIIEFIKRGYSVEDIKKLPRNILDDYEIIAEEYLTTKFPHDIKEESFFIAKDGFDRAAFNNAIINKIKQLTIEERLDALSFYFDKTKEPVYYIFSIQGIKGDETLKIGDVTIFAPGQESFLNEENSRFTMIFSESAHMYVAVEINYLMPSSSLQEAISKIENTFDLVSCYFKIKTTLSLNESNYVIANKSGELVSSSFGREKNDTFILHHEALDSKYLKDKESRLNEYAVAINKRKSDARIKNSLHWYRKAEESTKTEDKVLNYWISIENLFSLDKNITDDILSGKNKNKIHLIQECVASAYAVVSMHDNAWDLFTHFSNQHAQEKLRHIKDRTYKFNEDILTRSQINRTGVGRIYLKNFVACLEEIKNCVTDKIIFYRIEYLQKLYTDANFLKKHIENEITVVKNNILLAYRFRNMIVHNAHYENMLLPYFSSTINTYSRFFIQNMIKQYDRSDGDLSKMLLHNQFIKEVIISELEQGKIKIFEKGYD